MKRIEISGKLKSSINLDHFVTYKSWALFDKINLPNTFLHNDVKTWQEDVNYMKAKEIVDHLKVVNDSAERAIETMQTYNQHLTTQEDQLQYVLQLIEHYRKTVPTCTKKSFIHHQNVCL